MEDSQTSQIEFSKSINISKQLINDILGYRRNMSKEVVIKLAKHFAMNQEAFSRNYNLRTKKMVRANG